MGKSDGVFAIRVGRQTGIFDTWEECKAHTHGYPGAQFRKWPTHAAAQAYLDEFHKSAGNVFPVKPPSTTRATANARVSAAPYSIPNMASKSSAKPDVSTVDDGQDLADAQSDAIVVYTDGASKNNQDAASRIAGYGVHWARGRPSNIEGDIAARCPGLGQTNNIGELLAIIRTLELTQDDPRPLRIYSDSKYSIDCFGYVKGWSARGWKKSDGGTIANVEMIKYMDALRRLRGIRGWEFKIEHVKGHASSVGNNTADSLANQGCLLPLDSAEPDWVAKWEAIEALIDAETRSKGRPVELHTTVKEDTDGASLVTKSAEVSTSSGLDDFSDIPLLSNNELLEELAAA
ncbi:unnamed protein product [Peniophora sp. CBMAI 1063]|nr:unnamed protein product [Peniophora sp. CBMAI 1063]